jgi:hypothetical protein
MAGTIMSERYTIISCERCAFQVKAEIVEETGVTAPDWQIQIPNARSGCIKPELEACPYLNAAISKARRKWEPQQRPV